jgi:hypothetical protein
MDKNRFFRIDFKRRLLKQTQDMEPLCGSIDSFGELRLVARKEKGQHRSYIYHKNIF